MQSTNSNLKENQFFMVAGPDSQNAVRNSPRTAAQRILQTTFTLQNQSPVSTDRHNDEYDEFRWTEAPTLFKVEEQLRNSNEKKLPISSRSRGDYQRDAGS